jgi:penicillin-binding protein 1A
MSVFRRIWRVICGVARVIRALVKTVVILLIATTVLPAAMGGTALGIALFTDVPVSIPEKRELPVILETRVFDSLNNQIATFKEFDSNIPVEPEDIPLILKQALISTEDRRFLEHEGVDLKGIGRAIQNDLRGNSGQQGASTLTMQLIKQRYSGEEQADLRDESKSPISRAGEKLRQAVLANRLDRDNEKEDILFDYLTGVYLGQGAYGVGAASQAYFRKPVSELTTSEAATLVGVIPAPSRYEPRGHRDAAEVKRKVVLGKLLSEGYIRQPDYDEAIRQELWVDKADGVNPPAGKPVTVVYQRPKQKVTHPYFVDYTKKYLIAKYGEDRVLRGGLAVYTTIDPVMQAQAEATADWLLDDISVKIEASIVSVEPSTGFVKALVGGRDFDAPGGQVNLALGLCPSVESLKKRLGHSPDLAPDCLRSGDIDGGGTGRSPGSSIKPIVLAAAYQRGITPGTVYQASAYKPGCADRALRNYEGASYGPVTLKQATIKSVNTTYARLGMDVGIRNVAKMAQDLGITSAWYDRKVHCASYALGGIDVSPLEMAAAYSVFANRGIRQAQTPILRVVDANGIVLEDNTNRRGKRVLSEEVADNVTDALEGVVTGGTGVRAQLPDRRAAGKTGTSQGNGNAWFVGYTPNLSTAVWIGYKDSLKPLRNLKGVRGGITGGSLPAMTWSRFMKVALLGQPVIEFAEPLPIKKEQVLTRAELLRRKARGGIDPGPRRTAIRVSGRRFIDSPGAPPLPGEEEGGFGVAPTTSPSNPLIPDSTIPQVVEALPTTPLESVPPNEAPVSVVPDPIPVSPPAP